jgi:hypothetical protein
MASARLPDPPSSSSTSGPSISADPRPLPCNASSAVVG